MVFIGETHYTSDQVGITLRFPANQAKIGLPQWQADYQY
jgi:hypothetical protein